MLFCLIGIRSGGDSVGGQRDDDSHDSSIDSPRLYDTESSTVVEESQRPQKPQRAEKAEVRQLKEKPMLSLAQPYQQIAQHLTFSQLHQQFILSDMGQESYAVEGRDRDQDDEDEEESSETGGEEADEQEDESLNGELDDDLFADDEDGHTAPESSSQEFLGASPALNRRQRGRKPVINCI